MVSSNQRASASGIDSLRSARRRWALAAWCFTGLLSTRGFAQEPSEPDVPLAPEAAPEAHTEESTKAEPPAPAAVDTPAAKPKLGDLSVSGYLRGGFGASNRKGRMTCFQLAIPGGLVSKYRLGNECEVWSETNFNVVAYSGADGTVATVHVMPTVYLPTTYAGYSPTGTISSPAQYMTSTGATLSFPNLYVDIAGIPWLAGGTAWLGTRYYKRESIYISDFFYWNPSGVGAGIEDIHLGSDLRLSYAVFAVDGEPTSPDVSAPPLPMQVDFGFRNDLQLRGIRPFTGAELQLGFQYIADYSNHPDANGDSVTHGGWGVTLQYVQQLLGGENKLAFQYGKGGGTGFGTLSRFYYPDFSLYFAPSEYRMRLVDVLSIQPLAALGAQLGLVYQHDDLGNSAQKTNWYSSGARLGYAFTEHAKLLGEVGYDLVKKSNGAAPQGLAKFTIAPAISMAEGFWARPELRLFYTWAVWTEAARTATIDSGRLYTTTDFLSGSTFGLQAETSW